MIGEPFVLGMFFALDRSLAPAQERFALSNIDPRLSLLFKQC
jgi:hypothetical protein